MARVRFLGYRRGLNLFYNWEKFFFLSFFKSQKKKRRLLKAVGAKGFFVL